LADHADNYTVGFKRPPKHARFAKGQSGNPHGRPKGSQNLATIFEKVCRERIRVTLNGKVRSLTKFEAAMLQLTNMAAAGDLKAINALRDWIVGLGNFEQAEIANPVGRESDSLVMASIIRRIRESETPPSEGETDNGSPDGNASREPHE
jgi:hypothetical protein